MFPLLIPGMYSVRVEMQGFRSAEMKSVEIVTGRTASVTIAMQPGAAGEVVEVSDAAVTVDTTSSAISTNLNDTFYSQVPVGRNVTSIFYASAGVNTGGGTGAANPSISGGTGLENQYVADGVNITDGAFGGIGVYSRVYGSLSTGINLSFVKEVQVKTSGYEPQYGKTTGGLVQIVTKSGSNEFHGGISAFFGPREFEAERLNSDDFGRLNLQGRLINQSSYDVSAELGGYVPGLKNNLFFFGSFNPSWNRQFSQLSTFHGVLPGSPLLGTEQPLKQTSYNYAGKLTYKLTDNHQIESSVFGDPTRSNTSAFNTSNTFSDTTFSKLSNGTRNWVLRYNATLSPTWLFNSSFSWGHNSLTENPLRPEVFQVVDQTGCGFDPTTAVGASSSCRVALIPGTLNGPLGPISGQYTRQGIGYYENTEGDNFGLTFDTQKTWDRFLGSHSFYLGYRYEHTLYKGDKLRTGGDGTAGGSCFHMPAAMAMDGAQQAAPEGTPEEQAAIAGRLMEQCDNAAFQLRITGLSDVTTFVPGYGEATVGLIQTRGDFGNTRFDTSGRYHAAYLNDAWTINKYITVNIGWRWEQQNMQGTRFIDFLDGSEHQPHYTFTGNWSPRIGLSIDPFGDRKTKIFGNFARMSYAIPLDMAIRSLSNETSMYGGYWRPQANPDGSLMVNPDGTLPAPIFSDDNYLTSAGLSTSSTTAIAPGTKMQYLQEWVGGVEREIGKGIIVNVRYIDRRLKRAVEDMAGLSPEAYAAGVAQHYFIANPSPGTDLFINPNQIIYPDVEDAALRPAGCSTDPLAPFIADSGVRALVDPETGETEPAPNPIVDTFGIVQGGVCITNPDAGTIGSDGIADGFVNPVRIYKAVEVEVNKSFTAGWQLRSNYRWSQLSGNYEGAFRNDNGQSDPSISSLFDFTAGQYGLLGNQFGVGWLNTDRRHIFNNFLSYNFTSTFLKGLTIGTGVRVESGIPINRLKAHPVYLNAGEIPQGGRGALGRTSATGSADIHAEYKWAVTEKHSLQFGGDFFNITNQRTQLRVDQNEDRSFGVPNADFLKPTQGTGLAPQIGFQRPFYGRASVKWVF